MGVVKHNVRSQSREGSALINSRVKVVGYGDGSKKRDPNVVSQLRNNANDTALTNDNVSAVQALPSINMHKQMNNTF